jgi:hypothetical protein
LDDAHPGNNNVAHAKTTANMICGRGTTHLMPERMATLLR